MKSSHRGALLLPLLLGALAAGCATPDTAPAAAGNSWVLPDRTAATGSPAPTGAPSGAATAGPTSATATRAGTATAPAASLAAPLPKGAPAPLFPKGYTVVSQACALKQGERDYVSRSGKTKASFGFCTQVLRNDNTGGYHINPYVYASQYYFYNGQWMPDAREPVVLTITCRVLRQNQPDYPLTGVSPSGNGPMHTASCGRLVPYPVTATTGTDLYTVRFTGYTKGGFYGPVADDIEVHFPGIGKPVPEQLVRVPG